MNTNVYWFVIGVTIGGFIEFLFWKFFVARWKQQRIEVIFAKLKAREHEIDELHDQLNRLKQEKKNLSMLYGTALRAQ